MNRPLCHWRPPLRFRFRRYSIRNALSAASRSSTRQDPVMTRFGPGLAAMFRCWRSPAMAEQHGMRRCGRSPTVEVELRSPIDHSSRLHSMTSQATRTCWISNRRARGAGPQPRRRLLRWLARRRLRRNASVVHSRAGFMAFKEQVGHHWRGATGLSSSPNKSAFRMSALYEATGVRPVGSNDRKRCNPVTQSPHPP